MDKRTELNDELRPEYDETSLKNGIRGKYAERYAAGTNVIKLDPDVVEAFPNEKAVNEALKSLLKEKMKNQTFTASIWRVDKWFIAQCLDQNLRIPPACGG